MECVRETILKLPFLLIFFSNLCPNFPNKVKISWFLHIFREWNRVAALLTLPLVAEGLDLGIRPNLLDFCTLSPNQSTSASLVAKIHPIALLRQLKQSRFSGFLSCSAWFSFFWWGGNLLSSSASLSGRFVVIKILGLKTLAYVLTLGALFTALLFLSLMSERRIFVAISTGMCCAQTDVAVLPDLKRRRSDSVLISFE